MRSNDRIVANAAPVYTSAMNRFAPVALALPALLGAGRVSAPDPGPAPAPISESEYATRRSALTSIADSGVFVAFGARETIAPSRPCAQRPPFRYLTGFLAPDADLIMVKRGGHTTATLFVQSANPRREFY